MSIISQFITKHNELARRFRVRYTLLLFSLMCLSAIFSYADNNITFLGWFFVIFLTLAVRHSRFSIKESIFYGLYCGLFISVGGFHWLSYTLKTFGGMPEALAWLAFVLYALLFQLNFVLFFLLYRFFNRLHFPLWLKLAGLFTVAEYLAPQLFPWSVGAAMYRWPWFIQIADIGGVYALTFMLFVHVLAVIYLYRLSRLILHLRKSSRSLFSLSVLRNRIFRPLIFSGLVLFTLVVFQTAYGLVRYQQITEKTAAAGRLNAAMLQPNSPLQYIKGQTSATQINQEMTRTIFTVEYLAKKAEEEARKAGRPNSLLVVPEGAFPSLSSRRSDSNGRSQTDIIYNVLVNDEIYSQLLHKMVLRVTHNEQAAVFMNELNSDLKNPYGKSETKNRYYYNTSVLYDANGRFKDEYRKIFLLPFGETIPFPDWLGRQWILEETNASDFQPGREQKLITLEYPTEKTETVKIDYSAGLELEEADEFNSHATLELNQRVKFVPLICYEVLSGEFIRNFKELDQADFMVNVTNDRWFGDEGKESWQHLQLGMIRAVEFRRSIVRSTNSGVSALVLPTGELDQASITGQAEKTFRNLQVPLVKESTFYMTFGNWLPTGLTILFLVLSTRRLGAYYRRLFDNIGRR